MADSEIERGSRVIRGCPVFLKLRLCCQKHPMRDVSMAQGKMTKEQ